MISFLPRGYSPFSDCKHNLTCLRGVERRTRRPGETPGAAEASVDRLCDYRRADINGKRLTPGPERGQHQAPRALIKRGGGGGEAWPRREKVDVILPDHHAGPRVLSDRRPLITFKFFSAHEKTRRKKKKTH